MDGVSKQQLHVLTSLADYKGLEDWATRQKQGIIVVRMRVGTGGMRKQRPTGGRRPKHLGVTRIKADDDMKTVANRRVLERYPNMKLLGSYFIYKDGKHYWFEVILADPDHPRIAQDKELNKRVPKSA